MNNQHVKGTINQIKGRVKEEVGHHTGDSKMEAKGVAERVIGKIQNGLGDLKDAVKAGVDKVLHSNAKTAFLAAAVFTGLASAPALAVDNEDSVTTSTSQNPFTGTQKTTKNIKHKKTHADGSVSESNTQKTEKVKRDGSTSNELEHESTESAPKR